MVHGVNQDPRNEIADLVPNHRFNSVMCHRDISIGGVDLDVGEEEGCSWTKVGLPTKYAQYDLGGDRTVFF